MRPFGVAPLDDFQNRPLSLIISQGAGIGERFHSESDLALESEYVLEPDSKSQRPKIFEASH